MPEVNFEFSVSCYVYVAGRCYRTLHRLVPLGSGLESCSDPVQLHTTIGDLLAPC